MYNQNILLLDLYHYRFATQDQLRQILGHKGNTQASQLLKILCKHRVVEYFEGKSVIEPRVYYLTAEGCRYLLANEKTFGITSIPRHVYRNSEASELFVEHSKRVLGIYLNLKKQYGDGLHFTTKVELGSAYSLKPLPDGEVTLNGQKYLIEYFDEGVWKSLLRRRLWQLYSHWQLTADTGFLLVAADSKQKFQIAKQLSEIDADFAEFCEIIIYPDQINNPEVN